VFEPVAPGLARLGIVFVNVYALGEPEGRWVLVDAGLKGSEGLILRSAARLFGAGARPEAIVLTHGHFDHVGSARRLADAWGVPLYAHPLELPYLTGLSDFPPRDPTMGGAMAHMSRLMPDHGYDFGGRVLPLPTDGGVPGAPGWLWLHTPGHTPGHVSLMRESDGVLLAGDAFATMDLDSWSAYLTRRRAFNRPSPPFTADWATTRDSIERLAKLEPAVVATGYPSPATASQKNFGGSSKASRHQAGDAMWGTRPAPAKRASSGCRRPYLTRTQGGSWRGRRWALGRCSLRLHGDGCAFPSAPS
jgi:glyoxylase-like metal-dependent hydrolase (beta-lactamase superfamily II)